VDDDAPDRPGPARDDAGESARGTVQEAGERAAALVGAVTSRLGDAVGGGEQGEVADAVAEAVLRVPGVTGLHGGRLGEVATYLPGRRVGGVRIGDDGTGVHVVVDPDASLRATAAAVRDAVAPHVRGPITVVVEDLEDLEGVATEQ
jgi:hypothetical protein